MFLKGLDAPTVSQGLRIGHLPTAASFLRQQRLDIGLGFRSSTETHQHFWGILTW